MEAYGILRIDVQKMFPFLPKYGDHIQPQGQEKKLKTKPTQTNHTPK